MFKKVLFVLALFMINSISVNAGICDKENIDYYKEFFNNIDIIYEPNEEAGNGIYKVTIAGLLEDTSVRSKELDIERKFSIDDYGVVILENVKSGVINFNFYYDKCDTYITTRKINIPVFNEYSLREECNGIEDLDVCKSDYEYPLNESTFLKKIKDYNKDNSNKVDDKNSDSVFNKVIDFLSNYYLYIVGGIVVVSLVIIYIFVKKKRYTLE